MRSKNKSKEIIVTMTTWKGRVDYCHKTINSILNQSHRIDRLVINLSYEEFQSIKDLPNTLLDLIKKDKRIEVYFMLGNYKCFKKLIPTLERYKQAIVISVDDDIDYPADMVEVLLKEYDGTQPITTYKDDYGMPSGACSLYEYKFFGELLHYFDCSNVVFTNEDDLWYWCIVNLNGFHFKQIKYKNMFDLQIEYNNGLNKNHQYNTITTLRKIIDYCKNNFNVDIFAQAKDKNAKKIKPLCTIPNDLSLVSYKKISTKQLISYYANNKTIQVKGWLHFSQNERLLHYNLGDELNLSFLNEISKNTILPYSEFSPNSDNLIAIGSILTDGSVDSNSIIWGGGVENINEKLTYKPKDVRCVRGPITRSVLIKNGIDCPPIYGDPAMLLPLHYYPKIQKKYKLGVILHHSTSNGVFIDNIKQQEDVCVIRMDNYSNWRDVVNLILECENICSESLHGLVIAEAYHIPNLWITYSYIRQRAKFHDFFLSLGTDKNEFFVNDKTTKEDILKKLEEYEYSNFDYSGLINSCPFNLSIQRDDNDILLPSITKDTNLSKQKDIKTAIFCMAKKENRYIRHWVEYHLELGFDTIYINDNNDVEDERIIDVIGDYVKEKKVVIINRIGENITLDVKNSNSLQNICMEECYRLLKSKYDWITIIDVDEYITLDNKFENINQFLSQSKFDNYKIIKIFWKIFDDNNLINADYSTPIYQRLTHEAKQNVHNEENKCFFRTNIENFILYSGTYTTKNPFDFCCNSEGHKMLYNGRNRDIACIDKISYNDCYIKHFMYGTIQDFFENRLKRGTLGNGMETITNRINSFFSINTRTPEKEELFNKYLAEYQYNLEHPTPHPLATEDNTEIFILGYKQFDCPVHNANLYRIVDLKSDNAIRNDDKFHYDVPIIYTDKKNTISNMNDMYDEWTGIYWLWKNYDWSKTEYVGLCQYRRYFEFLDNPDWEYLNDVEMNVGQGIMNKPNNNGNDYKNFHNVQDLADLLKLLAQTDLPSANLFLKSTTFFPSNLLILHKSDFFDFCAFVFGYIKKFQVTYNLYTYEQIQARVKANLDKYPKRDDSLRYQSQMLAFLMERLTNIWISKNLLAKRRIRTLPCVETEDTGQCIFKLIEK